MKTALPAFPIATKDSGNSQKIMHVLRHFHLGNPTANEQLEAWDSSFLPAFLANFRDVSHLRYDYPLVLKPVIHEIQNSLELNVSDLALRLADFLQLMVESFAPADDVARILKDNLAWIERDLRSHCQQFEGPQLLNPLLKKSCNSLMLHLKLKGDNQQKLEQDINKLTDAVDEQALILAYGRFPALHLLMYLIQNQLMPQLNLFKQNLEFYIKKLDELIEVDDAKQEQAKSAQSLKSNIASNQFFNTESLSKVIKHSHGSVLMSRKRRKRIEEALATLKKFKEQQTIVHIIYSSPSLDGSLLGNSEWLDKTKGFVSQYHNDPCFRATEVFDEEAANLARVFAAARIAKLEIENVYDENIHDPWFKSFNWEVFSQHELVLVPSVIVLESANSLADESMVSFSHLLNSGRPIHVFVRVQAHNNPGAKKDEDPFQNYRTELGFFGISHRQAVVTQSSAARHQHLLQQFATALKATRTSLHLINVGLREIGDDMGLNAWLVSGAALESRAHPFFLVNPIDGDSAAQRMHFDGNPQAEKDWPLQLFSFIDDGGDKKEIDLAFTFADYALLIPRLHHHFGIVPASCESQYLLPIANYLDLASDPANKADIDNYVPYVLAVDKHNVLRMLVVSRALVHACKDRLNFWRSLQEMAGVRSQYVEEAEKRIQQQADEKIAEQIAAAKAEFEEELSRVKIETASDVMSRLTDMLLGLDLSGGGSGFRPVAMPTANQLKPDNEVGESKEVAEEKEVEPEVDEVVVADPWIDSPLCTTCNDCLDINPLMFVYNDTNQAIVADLSSGTYAQMVEAAEVCPSKCIHPGLPWDNSEAGLDALIERASGFN